MAPFNMDTTSPSQLVWSSLEDLARTQGHYETASSASTLSLPQTSADSPSSPSSPSTTVTSIDPPPESQTEDELRAQLDQHIQSTKWFQADEPEPNVGAPGVPAWAAQLAPPGRSIDACSIYACFVKPARAKGAVVYKCSSPGCPFKSARLRRAVGHQRKKRNHKPFMCEAHPNWYVPTAAIGVNNID